MRIAFGDKGMRVGLEAYELACKHTIRRYTTADWLKVRQMRVRIEVFHREAPTATEEPLQIELPSHLKRRWLPIWTDSRSQSIEVLDGKFQRV
ncbi:hypothetical protein A0O30_19565 [Pseudomonas sp. LLC-1]|nr:hypothetical protein A0O30_19565 [Pseudomonas sp. LLC-1]